MSGGTLGRGRPDGRSPKEPPESGVAVLSLSQKSPTRFMRGFPHGGDPNGGSRVQRWNKDPPTWLRFPLGSTLELDQWVPTPKTSRPHRDDPGNGSDRSGRRVNTMVWLFRFGGLAKGAA